MCVQSPIPLEQSYSSEEIKCLMTHMWIRERYNNLDKNVKNLHIGVHSVSQINNLTSSHGVNMLLRIEARGSLRDLDLCQLECLFLLWNGHIRDSETSAHEISRQLRGHISHSGHKNCLWTCSRPRPCRHTVCRMNSGVSVLLYLVT